MQSRSTALVPLSINQCNAAYGSYGKPGKSFSQADVDFTTHSETLFSFGTIFSKGFHVLKSYLDYPQSPPSEHHMEVVLSKLLAYLLDKDELEAVKSVNKCGNINKCDLAVRFAQHFFSRLGVSDSYTLNKHSETRLQQCKCCKTNVQSNYGDTSIGNFKVWHGCLDILLESSNLSVSIIEDKNTDILGRENLSPEGNNDNKLEDWDVTSQMLAQTIVCSFTEMSSHPESDQQLFPSIGISRNNIIYYFYDCVHDILLKSPAFTIFDDKGVRYFIILCTWFVVNYKYLCSGLTNHMLQKAKKAQFFDHADFLLPVYESLLSLGGVPTEKPVVIPFQPWISVDSEFIDEIENDT